MLTFKSMNGELEVFQQSLSSTENDLKMGALNERSSPFLPNPLQCICSDLRVTTDFKGGYGQLCRKEKKSPSKHKAHQV